MSAAPVVALFSARAVDAEAVEWLRVLAAVVAVGRPARLLALGPGLDALAHDDLPPEAQRYLDAVAPLGVVPVAPDAADLREALASAGGVLRFGDPSRPRTPEVLELTQRVLDSLADEDLVQGLRDAGQVLRTRRGLS